TLVVYVAARPVLSSLIGRPLAMQWCNAGTLLCVLVTSVAVLSGLALLWRRSDGQTRARILVCLYLIFASGTLAIGARKMLRAERTITFGGERYFYLAACSFVVLAAISIEVFLPTVAGSQRAVCLLTLLHLQVDGGSMHVGVA